MEIITNLVAGILALSMVLTGALCILAVVAWAAERSDKL